MADNLTRKINIRLDNRTYRLLESIAAQRGESISKVARKVLSDSLQSETALNAQDILIPMVRKVVAKELRQTENRLSANIYKVGLAAASSEQCALQLLKESLQLNNSQVNYVQKKARHEGVIFLNQSFDVIKAAYSEGED